MEFDNLSTEPCVGITAPNAVSNDTNDLVGSPVAAQGIDIPLEAGVSYEDLMEFETSVVEPSPTSNAKYSLIVVETPYDWDAGEAVGTRSTTEESKVKVIPLEEFLTTYQGEVRGYMFNLRGGATQDESDVLGAIFTRLSGGFIGSEATAEAGVNGSPIHVILRARKQDDPIYINQTVTCYASNVTVEFRSPVIFGPAGALRMFGEVPEVLRNKPYKAKLSVDADEGDTTLTLDTSDPTENMQASDFVVGDTLVLRGENDKFGRALQKQIVHVTGIASNVLTLAEELEFDFLIEYPSSEWAPPQGGEDRTTISVAAFAALTVSAAANDQKIRVNRTQLESSGIEVGSVVQVATKETEWDINFNAHGTSTSSSTSVLIGTGSKTFVVASAADLTVGKAVVAWNTTSAYMKGKITAIVGTSVTILVTTTSGAGTLASWSLAIPYLNTARFEIKRVTAIAVVDVDESDVTFDSPLVDDYSQGTPNFGGITLYEPITNSTFKGIRASYSADQTSRNTHGIQIGYGYQCKIVNCRVDGSGGQKGNGIRVSNSLECQVIDGCVSNPEFSTSGAGYGIAIYVSDRCEVIESRAEGCRHNFLVQKANHTYFGHCKSVNDLISGFDVHGVRSFYTWFDGCFGIGGPGEADATHKSIFRVGNTSHACGDIGTIITNCVMRGARPFGSVTTYAGIEIFGQSANTVMKSCMGYDLNCCVRTGYDNARATEIDLITNAILEQNTWINYTTFLDAADVTAGTLASYLSKGGITRVDGATAAASATTTMPIDGSAPTVAEGDEIITTSYTAKQPNRNIKVTLFIPYVQVSTTINVGMAIFAGSTLIGQASKRVTTGANSGDPLVCIGSFVGSGAAQTISVRIGPHSAATININPASNDWAGKTAPFLLIEEAS